MHWMIFSWNRWLIILPQGVFSGNISWIIGERMKALGWKGSIKHALTHTHTHSHTHSHTHMWSIYSYPELMPWSLPVRHPERRCNDLHIFDEKARTRIQHFKPPDKWCDFVCVPWQPLCDVQSTASWSGVRFMIQWAILFLWFGLELSRGDIVSNPLLCDLVSYPTLNLIPLCDSVSNLVLGNSYHSSKSVTGTEWSFR